MIQNNTFLDSNFEWIFFVLASENEGKIEQLAHFYRKRNFCENHCFPEGKSLFFDSPALVQVQGEFQNIETIAENAIKNPYVVRGRY